MAIKISGTTVVTDTLNLNNITSVDAGSVSALAGAGVVSTTDTLSSVSGSAIDLSGGTYFALTPSANITVTFTNPPASGNFKHYVIDVTPTAAITITWPDSILWVDGTTPTLSGANTTDIFNIFTIDGGTSYYGVHVAG